MFSSFNQTFNRALVILLLCCSFLVGPTIQSRTPRPVAPSRGTTPHSPSAADTAAGVVVCDKVCLYIVINFPAWEGCNPTYPNSTQVGILMNRLQHNFPDRHILLEVKQVDHYFIEGKNVLAETDDFTTDEFKPVMLVYMYYQGDVPSEEPLCTAIHSTIDPDAAFSLIIQKDVYPFDHN